VKLESHNRL